MLSCHLLAAPQCLLLLMASVRLSTALKIVGRFVSGISGNLILMCSRRQVGVTVMIALVVCAV